MAYKDSLTCPSPYSSLESLFSNLANLCTLNEYRASGEALYY